MHRRPPGPFGGLFGRFHIFVECFQALRAEFASMQGIEFPKSSMKSAG